jgi:hypothetical protein
MAGLFLQRTLPDFDDHFSGKPVGVAKSYGSEKVVLEFYPKEMRN